jgi:uncharacterized protein YecT (DUF1311 family)
MANSYQLALKSVSTERKETVQRQQAGWLADYIRTCNAPLSEMERYDCINQHLNDRLATIWK